MVYRKIVEIFFWPSHWWWVHCCVSLPFDGRRVIPRGENYVDVVSEELSTRYNLHSLTPSSPPSVVFVCKGRRGGVRSQVYVRGGLTSVAIKPDIVEYRSWGWMHRFRTMPWWHAGTYTAWSPENGSISRSLTRYYQSRTSALRRLLQPITTFRFR